MKVALVQCPLWSVSQPPPGLAYIAAALRSAGIETEVHDLEVELYNEAEPAYRQYFAPDVGFETIYEKLGMDAVMDRWARRIVDSGARIAGLAIFYSTEDASFDLARRIRALDPSVKILFGGPSCHRQVHGEKFIQDPVVDAVVTGEGEETIVEIVQGFDEAAGLFPAVPGALVKGPDGEVVDGGPRPQIHDLDSIAIPDYSDFDLDRFARPGSLPLLTSRGCINRCKFCSERKFWHKYRMRSPENIFAEIKRHADAGVHHFYWVDSLINGHVRKLDRLLDLIIESGLNVRWYGMATIRKEMTPALLNKMRRAGCVLLQYGIESASPRVRSSMGKSGDIELIERVVRDTHEAGVRIQALIIIGYPTERLVDYLRTLHFLWRNRKNIDLVVRPTCPYVCLPNSILFEERDAWGVVLEEGRYAEWTSPDGKNTYARRQRRLRWFHWFCKKILRLPSDIGPDVFTYGDPVSVRDAEPIAEEDRRARMVRIDGPLQVSSRETATYTVRLANAGGVTLHDWKRGGGRPIGLGYHWLDTDGGIIVFDDGQRAYLEEPLAPGEEATLTLTVTPPRTRNRYTLRFAVVQEGVAWFETDGPDGADLTVQVT